MTLPSSKRTSTMPVTSEEAFNRPSGPEAYTRPTRIVAIPYIHSFCTNVTSNAVHKQVVVLLDQRKIKVTSFDFVRLTWLDKHPDREIEDDDDKLSASLSLPGLELSQSKLKSLIYERDDAPFDLKYPDNELARGRRLLPRR
ncbi:hypothetical protein C8Q78DRAFT_1075549 [Trametes maxima]|nr:hypothetical protein C8Q78DRAFT_1075549 [Trametes maxima]